MESPMHSQEEDEFEDAGSVRKKLLFSDDLETTQAVPSQKQPVLIYLRVRPKRPVEVANEDPDCFHSTSKHEIVALPPTSSKTYKNSRTETSHKFSFSHIFNPSTTQKELFDHTVRPLLKDFFDGQNCLIFTYGVTNSGKSYTITGTPSQPGILPRALDVIFSSLDIEQQLSEVKVHPKCYSELKYLSNEEVEKEQQWKIKILNLAHDTSAEAESAQPLSDEGLDMTGESDLSSVSTLSKLSSTTDMDGISFEDFQLQDQDQDHSLDLQGYNNHQFAIFVSFAEIYNEFVYDLLMPTPAKGKHRSTLRIGQDKYQNNYIKGLHEVEVRSVEEAMLVLKLGIKHRKVAATRLNYHSSRSHSIYTIKLVRLANVDKPSSAIINRISIVDLAGAERSVKTGASGIRVKEAGNINQSLFTLGKCIEAMKRNQNKKSGDEHTVPFRESKLTRLFQNYFIGKGEGIRKGKITMFVNVSNNASVFDETFHVLKFSALTSKVEPLVKKVPNAHMQFLSACPPPTATPAPLPGTAKEVDEKGSQHTTSQCENCKHQEKELLKMRESSIQQIQSLRNEMLEQEYVIRQEICKEFAEQLTEIEEDHDRKLAEQADDFEDMYEKRLELYRKSVKKANRKRRRLVEDDGDAENVDLQATVAALKDRVEELEKELSLERKRTSAEIQDASETYQTNTVKLNEQLVETSLQLSEARKAESKLVVELEAAHAAQSEHAQHIMSLKAALQQAKDEEAALLDRVDKLQEETEQSGAKTRELTIAQLKIEEVLVEKGQWEQERIGMISRLEGLERDLVHARRESMVRAGVEHAESPVSWEQEKVSFLTNIQLLEEERSLLATESEKETSKLKSRIVELEREVVEAKTDGVVESEILQARISELIQEKVEANTLCCSLRENIEELKTQTVHKDSEWKLTETSLRQELESMGEQLCEAMQQLKTTQTVHKDIVLEAEWKQTETSLRQELEALGEQLREAMQQSQRDVEHREVATNTCTTTLEEELAAKEKEIASLKDNLQVVTSAKDKLYHELQESVQQTLMDYQTTLKGQGSRIEELEGESQGLQHLNQALEEKLSDVEIKLQRSRSSKESLELKMAQLSEQLDNLRKAASQRETELQDSADQCRAVLEDQVASLRKQLASLEHDLHSTKEDLREAHEQARTKDQEFLSVMKEQSTVSKLTLELEESSATIVALKGQHQLECAQLNIKVRELSQELKSSSQEMTTLRENLQSDSVKIQQLLEREEVAIAKQEEFEKLSKKQGKELKQKETKLSKLVPELKEKQKLCHMLQSELDALMQDNSRLKEKISSLEKEEDEHIYEEPPEVSLVSTGTVYESVTDDAVDTTAESNGHIRRSYLKAVENLGSGGNGELDRSKPFVPNLESSSQLDDSSMEGTAGCVVIDATPLPVRRKGVKRGKKEAASSPHKDENKEPISLAKKFAYSLRSRKKQAPTDDVGEVDSLQDFTPTTTKRFKSWTTAKKKPAKDSTIASRTRKKVCKDQISAPLSFVESPVETRNRTRGRVLLGTRVEGV